MKKRISSTLEAISRLIPLNLYPFILRRDVIDFFWHVISDEPMPHVRHLYPVVPAEDFEAALLFLKENFIFVSYAQLHAYKFEGAQLPPKAVHISFDDGYVECFKVVRPLLQKYGIPCTFFLTTDLIENKILFYRNKQSLCVERLTDPNFKFQSSLLSHYPSTFNSPPSNLPEFITWLKDLRLPDEPLINDICHRLDVDWETFLEENQPYLTNEQILQMHDDGFTMGAHTMTHRKLVDLSSDEIKTEISQSCQIIGEITGQNIVPFSFPNSAWGLDRDLLAATRAEHQSIGLLFDTKGLRRDTTFIHNRVWAERPLAYLKPKENGAQSIKAHLRRAYQEAWADEMIAKARGLR